jgi:hypothetical protein
MKKLNLIALMLILSVKLFALPADSLAKSDTSKITFGKVYGDIKTAITAIGSSLKVGAEHVYEVLVKQQMVYSVCWLIFFIVCIAMTIIYVKLIKYGIKEEWDDDGHAAFMVFGGMFIVAIFGIFCAHLDNLITGFINPEYGAIQDIFQLINNK